MAVATELTLPSQPAVGSLIYRDLGGDGVKSPKQLVTVRVQSDGDASGGQNTIEVTMDPVYLAMVHWCNVSLSGGVPSLADAVVRFEIKMGPLGADTFNVRSSTFGASLTTSTAMFTPPPIPLIRSDSPSNTKFPSVLLGMENLNGTNMTMILQLYLWQRDAQFKTPIEELVAPLGRGLNALELN